MKYYRVKQDNFLWKKDAILKKEDKGYNAIEDIWDSVPLGNEYISTSIVEHPDNEAFFERVYQDTVTGKLFKTKDQLLEIYNGAFVK